MLPTCPISPRLQDIRDISVDCLYPSRPYLEVESKPCVIPAGKRTEIAFSFFPRTIMRYTETVTFLVNGLSRVDVAITGQGTELKVGFAMLCGRLIGPARRYS